MPEFVHPVHNCFLYGVHDALPGGSARTLRALGLKGCRAGIVIG